MFVWSPFMQRLLLSIIAAVISVASIANTADAAVLSIRLCNQYRQVADFALAYQKNGLWTSMGWWRVSTGKCTAVSETVPADVVYLSYVYPAEQTGLVHTQHRFAVGTNVDHPFRIQNADRPHAGTAMFSFMSSPTYVGNSTMHVTFTMLNDGSTMQWG
jgi:uncharacterized membrane protein